VSPTSCKGTGSFTSHGPLGMPQKCHKTNNQEAFAGLCICSCRDMSKDHSILTPQQKGPNKKPLYVNNRELLIFQVPCPSLGAAFPFSLINPTLCTDLVVSQVSLLPHKPILCPTEARTLDTACNISSDHKGTPLLDQGQYD
jgi:hypothetical protein